MPLQENLSVWLRFVFNPSTHQWEKEVSCDQPTDDTMDNFISYEFQPVDYEPVIRKFPLADRHLIRSEIIQWNVKGFFIDAIFEIPNQRLDFFLRKVNGFPRNKETPLR